MKKTQLDQVAQQLVDENSLLEGSLQAGQAFAESLGFSEDQANMLAMFISESHKRMLNERNLRNFASKLNVADIDKAFADFTSAMIKSGLGPVNLDMSNFQRRAYDLAKSNQENQVVAEVLSGVKKSNLEEDTTVDVDPNLVIGAALTQMGVQSEPELIPDTPIGLPKRQKNSKRQIVSSGEDGVKRVTGSLGGQSVKTNPLLNAIKK